MMTSIPFSTRSFPVNPRISQEGDQLQRMVFETLFSRASLRVFSAPAFKRLVTSFPVTFFLNFFSSQVKKARPFFRFIGGRGQGRPPSISGQIEMSSTSGLLLINFFMKELKYNFFPCQRQGTPRRHDETKTFSFDFSIFLFHVPRIKQGKYSCQA